jgi:mono/diheme cytochrome c family protein
MAVGIGRLKLLIFGGIALVWPLAAHAQQATQVGSAQQGLRLAREICAQCHLVDKAVGRSTNANAPTFEVIANTPGLTSAALAAALQTSHRTMPNIVIKGADANNIIAYILSLKESD